MLKGSIPVADESYDLGDPVGTGQTLVKVALGFGMLFAAIAAGQEVWNRTSDATDAVSGANVDFGGFE